MTVVDPPITILVALDEGDRWDTSNHTGIVATPNMGNITLDTTKPNIQIIYDFKQIQQGQTNNIFILETSDVTDFSQYSQRKRYNHPIKLSVTIAQANRPNVLAKYWEARRILETLSTTIGAMSLPLGYTNCFDELWVLGKRDNSDQGDNLHMITMDIELKSYGVVLAT